jgi:hypothetical protein
VWIAVTYATAIVFEIVKLWQASDRTTKEMFFGSRRSSATSEGKTATM